MSNRILVVCSFVESARSGGAQIGKPLTEVFSEIRNAIFSDALQNGKVLITSSDALALARIPSTRAAMLAETNEANGSQ
jgi:hypothetical protein